MTTFHLYQRDLKGSAGTSNLGSLKIAKQEPEALEENMAGMLSPARGL